MTTNKRTTESIRNFAKITQIDHDKAKQEQINIFNLNVKNKTCLSKNINILCKRNVSHEADFTEKVYKL